MSLELSETSETPGQVLTKSSDKSAWRPFKQATSLVLLFVLGIMALGQAAAPAVLPGRLSGVWQTSSDQYANSYMEFSPITIVFGTVEGGSTLYFVTGVEETKVAGDFSYVIHYVDLAKVRYEMALRYKPGPDPVLYVQHQPKVPWKKRPSA